MFLLFFLQQTETTCNVGSIFDFPQSAYLIARLSASPERPSAKTIAGKITTLIPGWIQAWTEIGSIILGTIVFQKAIVYNSRKRDISRCPAVGRQDGVGR